MQKDFQSQASILAQLTLHKIDVVVVGGWAMVFQGATTWTEQDLIAMKSGTGRGHDEEHVRQLRAIQRVRDES